MAALRCPVQEESPMFSHPFGAQLASVIVIHPLPSFKFFSERVGRLTSEAVAGKCKGSPDTRSSMCSVSPSRSTETVAYLFQKDFVSNA